VSWLRERAVPATTRALILTVENSIACGVPRASSTQEEEDSSFSCHASHELGTWRFLQLAPRPPSATLVAYPPNPPSSHPLAPPRAPGVHGGACAGVRGIIESVVKSPAAW
jgi:hypothetical protein